MLVSGLRRVCGAVGFGLTVAALAACSNHGIKAMTSGQIGCAEQDVQIVDKHVGWADVTWTADCHGKRFYCSSFTTGIDKAATSHVNCKEAVASQAQPAAAAAPTATPAAADQVAGCQYDTQCKGDRICAKGECVAPSSVPSAAPPASSRVPSAAPPVTSPFLHSPTNVTEPER